LEKAKVENGIHTTVFSIGVGKSHSASFMSETAKVGSEIGKYWYINDIDAIQT